MQLQRPSHTSAGALVLVVDDDQELRTCLQMVLEEDGYTVLVAPNGAVALEFVGHYRPAVIVLDVQMPVMDGPEFVRAYRSTPGPHAPILLLTASCYAATRAEELDVSSFLGKPFDLDALLDEVRACIARSGVLTEHADSTGATARAGAASHGAPHAGSTAAGYPKGAGDTRAYGQ
jgi:two-component system, chemotaxis family, chemotaxis protein CheY